MVFEALSVEAETPKKEGSFRVALFLWFFLCKFLVAVRALLGGFFGMKQNWEGQFRTGCWQIRQDLNVSNLSERKITFWQAMSFCNYKKIAMSKFHRRRYVVSFPAWNSSRLQPVFLKYLFTGPLTSISSRGIANTSECGHSNRQCSHRGCANIFKLC